MKRRTVMIICNVLAVAIVLGCALTDMQNIAMTVIIPLVLAGFFILTWVANHRGATARKVIQVLAAGVMIWGIILMAGGDPAALSGTKDPYRIASAEDLEYCRSHNIRYVTVEVTEVHPTQYQSSSLNKYCAVRTPAGVFIFEYSGELPKAGQEYNAGMMLISSYTEELLDLYSKWKPEKQYFLSDDEYDIRSMRKLDADSFFNGLCLLLIGILAIAKIQLYFHMTPKKEAYHDPMAKETETTKAEQTETEGNA